MKKINLFLFWPLFLRAMQDVDAQQFLNRLDPSQFDQIETLLETDCIHLVNHCYSKDHTPLMCCANLGWSDFIPMLIEFGAQVNARNVNKSTALILAASNGHARCVELLLQAGADPMLKNKDGLTARGWAEKFKHDDVVKTIDDFVQDPKCFILKLQLRARNVALQHVQKMIPEKQEDYVASVPDVLREKFHLTRVGKRKRRQNNRDPIKKIKLSQ